MNSRKNVLLTTLIVLGLGDLVMVPVMMSAPKSAGGPPPAPAIVLGALIGLATLAALPGVRNGSRRAFRVSLAARVLDVITMALGAVSGPGLLFNVVGVVGVVLSVLAIVLLVRLGPARAAAAQDRPGRTSPVS